MQPVAPDDDGDKLAPEALLTKLTLHPLKALLAAHGADQGIANKCKKDLVDRLFKIRKVTVHECEAHLPGRAADQPKTGASRKAAQAKSSATKASKLEQYFAGGGRDLKCSSCTQPLTRVKALHAAHGHHTFWTVSCGRWPTCKKTHHLNDVYINYRRLLEPRLVFEAHSLRGVLGAAQDAFSVTVDASNVSEGRLCRLAVEMLTMAWRRVQAWVGGRFVLQGVRCAAPPYLYSTTAQRDNNGLHNADGHSPAASVSRRISGKRCKQRRVE